MKYTESSLLHAFGAVLYLRVEFAVRLMARRIQSFHSIPYPSWQRVCNKHLNNIFL